MPIYETIRKEISGTVLKDEMLKEHTSIRIGGPAEIFAVPEGYPDMKWLIRFLKSKRIKYFIIGKGTNIIFSDNGYKGVVIDTKRCFNEIKIERDRIFVGSGVDLLTLINKSAKAGLSCLENLAGIPGTIGGAVWMNAGAFGTEIKDCVERVSYINEFGQELTEKSHFSYRLSSFKKGDVITNAEFRFEKKEAAKILKRIENVQKKRCEKQPLESLSAGSIFKNPQNAYAGEIIDRLKMRGMCVGDAIVSQKHANFIVNKKNASCKDVRTLIDIIRDRVRKAERIELELEVEFVEA